MRLVDDEEVESRRLRLLREAGLPREVLERDDGAPVRLERVESVAVLLRDVLAALAVEEDERLVELPVELAEPLDGERRGSHDEDAVGALRAQEAREDEARLDRLPEADFVREEPADRVARGRALGDVELVREDRDPPAEERPETARLADLREEEAVETVPEGRRPVGLEGAEPVDGIVRGSQGPQEGGRDDAPVRESGPAGGDLVDEDFQLLALEPRLLAGAHRHGTEGAVVRGEREARVRGGKVDDDPPPVDLLDAPRSEVGVELVEELVVVAEGRHGGVHGAGWRRFGQVAS